MNRFFERIFDRWSKWEIKKTNVAYEMTVYASPIMGGQALNTSTVYFDIYERTNKFTGIKETKKVMVS